jgi:hypothetical protein
MAVRAWPYRVWAVVVIVAALYFWLTDRAPGAEYFPWWLR